jgi:hypothetical protein
MSDMFDPDDLAEIESRFRRITAGESEGYEMIFYISHNDAVDLVDAYRDAVAGEPMAMARCWTEFMQIMLRLEMAMADDISDN